MPVTLRDIAQKAGVSVSAVSHALTGYSKSGMKAETRERIQRVAAEMEYQPNVIARSLNRGRTNTLGVVAYDLLNPFYMHLVKTAESLITERGYRALISSLNYAPEHAAHPDNLMSLPVDGALICDSNWSGGKLHPILAQDLPVVFLNDSVYPAGRPPDVVFVDLVPAARRMAEHLIARGARHIGFVSPFPRENWQNDSRHAACQDVCEQAGVMLNIFFNDAPALPTPDFGRALGAHLQALHPEDRPDALFCQADILAIHVYHGLLRAGLRVPEEIAVAGCDGIEWGQFLDKPLTTIRIPAEPLCRLALEMLVGHLQDESSHVPQRIRLEADLLIGETT